MYIHRCGIGEQGCRDQQKHTESKGTATHIVGSQQLYYQQTSTHSGWGVHSYRLPIHYADQLSLRELLGTCNRNMLPLDQYHQVLCT